MPDSVAFVTLLCMKYKVKAVEMNPIYNSAYASFCSRCWTAQSIEKKGMLFAWYELNDFFNILF